MSDEQAQEILIRLWIDKAREALASAILESENGHISFAVNRLYYSCFYAVTALLLRDGRQFTKHSAVKAEFTKSYLKNDIIDRKWSKFYQKLFDDRQEGDYLPMAEFDAQEVKERILQTAEFIELISLMIMHDTGDFR